MLVATEYIETIIPQRKPFIMIDNLIMTEGNVARSNFQIKSNSIFCISNLFLEAGILENIAQTAAARMGYVCLTENKPVPVGFIGAVKNLIIHHLPKSNTTLTTEITIIYEVFNATIINGIVRDEQGMVAECEMKIFLDETK